MIFTSAEPGSEPVVVAAPGRRLGMVRYRCEATGSELLIEKDKATAESYVCPATGCVMTRVEEPEMRVIKVVKKVEVATSQRVTLQSAPPPGFVPGARRTGGITSPLSGAHFMRGRR
jgi:hypothetical protein